MSNDIILYFAAPKVIGDSARKRLRNQQKAEKNSKLFKLFYEIISMLNILSFYIVLI